MAQEQAALNFDIHMALQRQLVELDAEATQPVLQRIQARRGAGNPLPEAVQRHLEQGLNHDLSRVRIHDDAEADRLAKGVNALAFTTGTDIFFQAGRFNPNTQTGLELLAHEVTHTVQQSQGRVGRGIDPDASLETEARAMGARLAQSGPQFGTKHTPRPRAPLTTAPAASTVQRWGLGDLKKLTATATTHVRGAVQNIQKAAQQRVQKTVARVKKAATPVLKAARQSVTQTLRNAQQLRSQVSARIAKAGQTAREYGRQTLQKVKAKASAAAQQAQQQAAQLRVRAHQLAVRAATAVAHTKQTLQHKAHGLAGTLRQAASTTAAHLRDRAKAAAQTFKTTANRIVNSVKTHAQRTRARAQAIRQSVQKRVATMATTAKTRITALSKAARAKTQSLTRRIGTKSMRALRSVKGGLGKFPKNRPATALLLGGGAAFTAFQAIKQGGARGLWNAVKGKASEAWKWATSTEGKATLARLAVTVGVTVGAAALTGLTGGLAAPLLIMAAGSVAGGALGRLTQNAVLRTDDKYKAKLPLMHGVLDPKTMALDGALGLVMGPGGALAGGIVKGAAGNLGRYALKPIGQGLVQGARRVLGGRIAVNSGSRAALGNTSRLGQRDLMNRLTLVWKDMKQYNAKLARETWTDMQQSLYGSAGVAGRATKDIRSLLGGRKALRTRQFAVARDRISAMDDREVLTLAAQLKLPTQFSLNKLRELVVQGLVKTNHRLVARPIAREARKAALGASRRDLTRAAFGAPRQRGESLSRRLLRGTGNLLTAGPRATYRTILEKDAGWSKAISQGVGTGHLLSSVSNEAAKGAALAAKTEAIKPDGEQQPVNGLKLLTDAVLNSLGFNPDYLSEKALGAGMTDAAKATNAGVGAGGMNDPVQLEDAPQVANP
ncbi:eCIS core domain-containing protein [Deinococcus radiotolerans]|nr:DUF4157 domain-containing protein [Deinococcus radiotolerans]